MNCEKYSTCKTSRVGECGYTRLKHSTARARLGGLINREKGLSDLTQHFLKGKCKLKFMEAFLKLVYETFFNGCASLFIFNKSSLVIP